MLRKWKKFGESLRGVQDKLAEKRYYMNNMRNLVDENDNVLSSENN